MSTDSDTDHLVIVQDERVVCVVEAQRHASAITVARLICRLLVSEARVYACPERDAGVLSGGQPVPTAAEKWREIFRATPGADATAEVVCVH